MQDNKFFAGRRMLCDFHIPDWVEEIDMDCEDYVKRAKEAKVQRIEIMSKGHYGNSFYDTSVGWKSKGLKRDILSDIVPLCHDAGIKIDAYYNVWHNNPAGIAHPEWLQRKEDGSPVDDRHLMDEMCMNSPYRNHVFAQLVEMASNYELNGFWLDQAVVSPKGCYCEFCKSKFREVYGKELKPRSSQTLDEQFELEDFRKQTVKDFLTDAMKAVHEIKPGLDFFWNGSGKPFAEQNNHEITPHAKCLSTEMHHPNFIEGARLCRYMRNLARPFEFMIPEGLASWGDYTINTEKTLGAMGSLIAAHGGTTNISAVPSPNGMMDGRVYPGTFKTIGNVFGKIKEIEEYINGAEPVRDVVVLVSEDEFTARTIKTEAIGNRYCAGNNLKGICEILSRNHFQYDIVKVESPESEEILKKANLIILSDMTNIDSKWVKLLEKRVSEGASLIATYRTGLFSKLKQNDNFILSDMLGVDFEGFSPYSHVYLDLKNSSLSDGIQDAPLLVPGQFNVGSKEPKEKSCYVKTRPGVEVLSTYIEPLMEYEPGNIKARIYGHSHPFRPTEIPAVTLNKYGKGQCIYMGIPLGVSVCWTKSPWLEKLFVNAAKLVHTSVIDAQVPSLVEVNLMEQENRYMLHLIPFPLKSGSKFIEDDITLADIELCLRVPQPASIICENAEFEWDNKETNSVVLKINKLKDHAMFILNK